LQDKQAESLKERLVGRLALGGPREWRTVAWCIGHLGYSEKGMRRFIELTPSYRHALAEQQVGARRQQLWMVSRRLWCCYVLAVPQLCCSAVAGKWVFAGLWQPLSQQVVSCTKVIRPQICT
jgi:hypothetical protein